MEEARRGFWVIGVDCGEELHRMVVVDGSGCRGPAMDVRNQLEVVEDALARLVVPAPAGAEVRVVVEGVRGLGSLVCRVAGVMGFELWQANTVALNRFREVEGQPRKDDDWDAYLLARMCFVKAQGCRRVIEAQPEERQLGRLGRLHSSLTQQRSGALNRLRSRLLELAPEVVQRGWEGPAWDSRAMREMLTRWPALIGLERAHAGTLAAILRACTYGAASEDKARALRAMAKRIMLPVEEREIVALELTGILGEVAHLDESLAEVDGRMARLVAAHAIGRRLLEMPAVGPFTAATMVGEVLPLARHASESQVATYSGLTPLSRRSGKSSGRGRLARGVNKHVLRACYLSAVASCSASALDHAYYRKKRASYEGHPVPHVAAILALARQRAKVMYKLMTSDVSYNKETLIASHLTRIEQDQARVTAVSASSSQASRA
jgi:transposase